MQKQMIPDPIHTLLHMVNGLSNEKVTQNFRNKKLRETYPKKKKKIIQAGKKFQKAILHDPLTFCLLANQKKEIKRKTHRILQHAYTYCHHHYHHQSHHQNHHHTPESLSPYQFPRSSTIPIPFHSVLLLPQGARNFSG